MTSLLERLQKIQVQKVEELPDLSQDPLEQLNMMKVDFGTKYRGRKFQDVWETDQQWINWFLKHYQDSTKGSHRLMIHYIGLKIERAELEGSVVTVTEPQPQPSKTSALKGNGKPLNPSWSPKPKVMPAKELRVYLEPEEQSVWDLDEMESEMPIEVPVDVSHLEQRMLHMENAIQTILQAVEQMSMSQGSQSHAGIIEQ